MPYLLDTNVFIEAKNEFYGMDFCPAFWDWLVESNRAKKVFSVDKVRDELKARRDQLSDWAKSRGCDFFITSENREVLLTIKSIKDCIDNNNYSEAHKRKFMKGADCWLIAHAKVRDLTVVTREVYNKNTKKVKIPNICKQMNIRYTSLFSMLRTEDARFILGKDK